MSVPMFRHFNKGMILMHNQFGQTNNNLIYLSDICLICPLRLSHL
jgi:hypothetical protein